MTPAIEALRAAAVEFRLHEYEGVEVGEGDYAVAVAGGISPLGQRRRLPTAVDESALEHETILVSAGRRGLQVELDPRDLVQLTEAEVRALSR
jgi:hypothetical protein